MIEFRTMISRSIAKFFVAALLLTSAFGSPVAAWSAVMLCAVSETKGAADINLHGSWEPAKAGASLPGGAQLRTGADGGIVLVFSDATKLRLGPGTSFTLDDLQPTHVAVSISLGRLEAWVKKLSGRAFEAKTPTAVAAVRGTVFAFNVAKNGSTDFQLFSGRLSIADNSGRTVTLNSHQGLQTSSSGAEAAPMPLPPGAAAAPEPPGAPPKGPLQGAVNGPPPGEPIPGDLPPPPPPTAQQNIQSGVSGSTP